MRKTPIQEAIAELERDSLTCNFDLKIGILYARIILLHYIDKEMNEIVNAANWNGYFDNPKVGSLTGKEYYDINFKNK